MHYHHQHQHSHSCLMRAFHPRVVPEQICRGFALRGGEGCKAAMAALRGGSTLTQELVTLTVDISLERVSQVAGSHRPCLQPASDCAPAFICTVLLYRYVIPMVLPGSRYKQSFFLFFFFLDYFYPRPVLQSSSLCSCTNNSTGEQKGCHKVRNKWPGPVTA